MSLLKRLSVTLQARLDRAVGEIEDHEAVIEAGLDEIRTAIARLRAERRQLERRTQGLNEDIDRAQHEAANWQARAMASADSDDDRALECLRRFNTAGAKGNELRRARAELDATRQRLDEALARLQRRLHDEEQRRDALRVRDAQTLAASELTRLDERAAIDLERAMQRWDVDVTRAELRLEPPTQADASLIDRADALADAYRQDEEQAALRRQLDALKGGAQ